MAHSDRKAWFSRSSPAVQLFWLNHQEEKAKLEVLEKLALACQEEITHSYSLNGGNWDAH